MSECISHKWHNGEGDCLYCEIAELEAELAIYKTFADTYIAKRYANLPQLRADLKALDNAKS
jgi:hypothetical protein